MAITLCVLLQSSREHGVGAMPVRPELHVRPVTHLLGRCGATGGEVVITDNDKHEIDRFTMRADLNPPGSDADLRARNVPGSSGSSERQAHVKHRRFV